jgi:hypothetical protein
MKSAFSVCPHNGRAPFNFNEAKMKSSSLVVRRLLPPFVKDCRQSLAHWNSGFTGLGLRPLLQLTSPKRLLNLDAVICPLDVLPRQAKTL